MSVLTPELVEQFRRFDGASVANAIETFDVRLRNEGFADASIRCLSVGPPAAVGHAVTARIRCSSPPPVGNSYHDRTDWWTYIVSVPAPRFVVVEDIDERRGLGAFVGGVHSAILQALGCVAYATDGSVRDVDEIRASGFPLFASAVAVSHAFAHIVDFGQPVTVGGLTVATGDLLFGDSAGIQSIPPSLAGRLPDVMARMHTQEEEVVAFCRSPQFSIEGLRMLVRNLG